MSRNSANEKQPVKSGKDKKDPGKDKIQEDVNAMKAEKESKKSLSRWDTDGGMVLCL